MDPGMSADNRERMLGGPRNPERRRERGAALIEFALVFPMLLVLTLTVVDVSRAFFVKNLAYQAAREGVRVLVVSSSMDSVAVRTRVMQVTGAANVTLKNLTVAGPDANQLMSVSVGVEFNWLFKGMFSWLGSSAFNSAQTLTGMAWMRKEGA
jgi:Flp pilus assembly protein TadG